MRGDLSLAEDFRKGWGAIQMRFKRNLEDKDETPETHSFAISKLEIPHELTMQTAERSILYFPSEGQRTSVGSTQEKS